MNNERNNNDDDNYKSHNKQMHQTALKGQLGVNGDPMGIVQRIKIWPY